MGWPCDHCPVSGRECPAATLRNPRLCQRAADPDDEGIGEILGADGPIPAQSRGPSVPAAEAVPRPQWPLAIAGISWLARPEDEGAGDTIARVVGPIGGDAFKYWWRKLFGSDCGCGARQDILNARYPYA